MGTAMLTHAAVFTGDPHAVVCNARFMFMRSCESELWNV